MTILCLGDSITYGFGMPRAHIWTALVSKQTGHSLVNRGINGNTTGGMLVQLENQLETSRPDAVLLIGGGNDIMLSGTATGAQSNMGGMGHIAASKGVIPIFGTAPPVCPPVRDDWNGLTNFDDAARIGEVYNQWLRQMCRVFRHPMIDFELGLVRLAATEGRELREYYLDGLHMNALGHQSMANIAVRAFRELKL